MIGRALIHVDYVATKLTKQEQAESATDIKGANMLALVNYQARRTGDTYSIVQRDHGNMGTRIVIRTLIVQISCCSATMVQK